MKITNFTNQAPLTEQDAIQLSKAIKAFEKGEKQPEGRFTILKELKKGEF